MRGWLAMAVSVAVVAAGLLVGAAPAAQAANAPWQVLDAGYSHTCGIRTDRTLWCWGRNNVGAVGDGTVRTRFVPKRIGGATADWTSVSAGGEAAGSSLDEHSCAIRAAGGLWCWGGNSAGQLGNGTTTPLLIPNRIGGTTLWAGVSAGANHTCAIRRDHTLWCWGSNPHGQLGDGTTVSRSVPTRVGAATDWTGVSAGRDHTCGIRAGGTLWCWGWNVTGELGDGTTLDRTTPVQAGTATGWADVSVNGLSSCGVRADHTLWCWGEGFLGLLGNGGQDNQLTPTQAGTAANWTSVSLGGTHVCGTRSDGSAWCWSRIGSNGELGTVDPLVMQLGTTSPLQIAVPGSWAGITTGQQSTCGWDPAGGARCWGDNNWGQSGIGTHLGTGQVGVATRLAGTDWTQVSTGGQFIGCGVRADTSGWCWGGRPGLVGIAPLGNGDEIGHVLPVRIIPATGWATISASTDHACGIRTDRTLWCWGDNAFGLAGTDGRSTVITPAQVGVDTWAEVSAGVRDNCAIRTDHTLWCWGQQLGSTDPRDPFLHEPRRVGTATDWAHVSSDGTACAIRTNGTLWCWGSNNAGQVGDGTTVDRTAPVQIGTARTWASVAASVEHTCAVRTDGTLWCWGRNGDSELGDGTRTAQHAPLRIGTGTDWATVSTSVRHSCGLRTDHTAWCWGKAADGQLGDRIGTPRRTPLQVGSATTWTSISAGWDRSCGLRSDHSLRCWGNGRAFALGFQYSIAEFPLP